MNRGKAVKVRCIGIERGNADEDGIVRRVDTLNTTIGLQCTNPLCGGNSRDCVIVEYDSGAIEGFCNKCDSSIFFLNWDRIEWYGG